MISFASYTQETSIAKSKLKRLIGLQCTYRLLLVLKFNYFRHVSWKLSFLAQKGQQGEQNHKTEKETENKDSKEYTIAIKFNFEFRRAEKLR